MNRWRQRLAELRRSDAQALAPASVPPQCSICSKCSKPGCSIRFEHSEQFEQRTESASARVAVGGTLPAETPHDWREHIASLLSQPCPDYVSSARWERARAGALRFAQQWADQALRLGWTAVELYGVPPLWSRIDLNGCRALIRRSAGYRRHPGQHRHRDAVRRAAQISSSWPGASRLSASPSHYPEGERHDLDGRSGCGPA